MLINELTNQTGGTEEQYRESLKKHMWIFGVFVLVGVAVIASIIIVTNGALISGEHQSDYQAGFAVGLGSSFIAAGLVRFLKTRATLNNPERLRKSYTEYTDERNRFITMKTYQTASAVFISLLALASMVSVFFNPVVTSTLSVCLGLFVVIILAVRIAVKRKY